MAAATALAIIAGASAVSSAAGQYKAGKATKRVGEYEEKIYGMNAELAEWQAEDAIARGAEAEGRHRTAVKGIMGRQKAGYAGQGVDVHSGSAADVRADTAYLGELDALTIRNNARREAFGYKISAEDARARGRLARAGGNANAASLRNQAVGTLVSGAIQAYGIYKEK